VRPTRLIAPALVAAAAAAMMVMAVQTWLGGDEPVQRSFAGRVITTAELPAGHVLVASDLAAAPGWQASEQDLATAIRPLVGRSLQVASRKGHVLQDSDLAAKGSGAALIGKVPSGSRAVTVMLREAGPGVVLFPGATVDVLATMDVPGRSRSGRETVTRTIVEGVRVLAVNQDAAGKETDTQERRSLPRRMTVTLLTSPAQANQIELASAKGTIGLTLRPEGDTAAAGPAAATTESLVGELPGSAAKPTATSPTAPSAATPAPPPKPVWEVIVIKGNDTVRHPFPTDGGGSDGTAAPKGGSSK